MLLVLKVLTLLGVTALLGLTGWLVHQLRPAEPVDRFIWKCMRLGGGGAFDTELLNRTEALDYCTRSGTHQIVYVDDERKFIFYRSL